MSRRTLTNTRRWHPDALYRAVLGLSAGSIVMVIGAIAGALWWQSGPSRAALGWRFVTGSVWDEVAGTFGVLPFVFGTLFSSLIAVAVAVPVSLGAAVHLLNLRPRWLRTPFAFLIELLAAIPSVVYGLWGVFVLASVVFSRDDPAARRA